MVGEQFSLPAAMSMPVCPCVCVRTKHNCRRLGKARERLLEATGDYAFPPGGQLDEITGLRKQTRVRDLQFKVGNAPILALADEGYCIFHAIALVAAAVSQASCAWFCQICYPFLIMGNRENY